MSAPLNPSTPKPAADKAGSKEHAAAGGSNESVERKSDVPKTFMESFMVAKPMRVHLNKKTLRVSYVESNSPLLNRVFVGDQIVAVDGLHVTNSADLLLKLADKKERVVARFKHASFSYCEHNGATVERLQLEKDVFRTTGRAVNLFTVYFTIDKILDWSSTLRIALRYDARERVQVAKLDPAGLAAAHLRNGDVVREVNDHPIATKCMFRHFVSEAIANGQPVTLSIERLVSGDDALRDMADTSPDVLDIAQRQIQSIQSKSLKPAPKVLLSGPSSGKARAKVDPDPTEHQIQADYDPTKLKPCKNAKA